MALDVKSLVNATNRFELVQNTNFGIMMTKYVIIIVS